MASLVRVRNPFIFQRRGLTRWPPPDAPAPAFDYAFRSVRDQEWPWSEDNKFESTKWLAFLKGIDDQLTTMPYSGLKSIYLTSFYLCGIDTYLVFESSPIPTQIIHYLYAILFTSIFPSAVEGRTERAHYTSQLLELIQSRYTNRLYWNWYGYSDILCHYFYGVGYNRTKWSRPAALYLLNVFKSIFCLFEAYLLRKMAPRDSSVVVSAIDAHKFVEIVRFMFPSSQKTAEVNGKKDMYLNAQRRTIQHYYCRLMEVAFGLVQPTIPKQVRHEKIDAQKEYIHTAYVKKLQQSLTPHEQEEYQLHYKFIHHLVHHYQWPNQSSLGTPPSVTTWPPLASSFVTTLSPLDEHKEQSTVTDDSDIESIRLVELWPRLSIDQSWRISRFEAQAGKRKTISSSSPSSFEPLPMPPPVPKLPDTIIHKNNNNSGTKSDWSTVRLYWLTNWSQQPESKYVVSPQFLSGDKQLPFGWYCRREYMYNWQFPSAQYSDHIVCNPEWIPYYIQNIEARIKSLQHASALFAFQYLLAAYRYSVYKNHIERCKVIHALIIQIVIQNPNSIDWNRGGYLFLHIFAMLHLKQSQAMEHLTNWIEQILSSCVLCESFCLFSADKSLVPLRKTIAARTLDLRKEFPKWFHVFVRAMGVTRKIELNPLESIHYNALFHHDKSFVPLDTLTLLPLQTDYSTSESCVFCETLKMVPSRAMSKIVSRSHLKSIKLTFPQENWNAFRNSLVMTVEMSRDLQQFRPELWEQLYG